MMDQQQSGQTFIPQKFMFNVEQLKKLNMLLPAGYKFVTSEQSKKKSQKKVPKKRLLMGLPISSQQVLVEPRGQSSSSGNIGASRVSSTNTKTRQQPQSIPQPSPLPQYIQPITLPTINLQQYTQPNALSTQTVFKKLKNHPQIYLLNQVVPSELYCLSFQQIQEKVRNQGDAEIDGYYLNDMLSDVSKICLKIYESFPRQSFEYQETVSIEKYLKSITRIEGSVGGDILGGGMGQPALVGRNSGLGSVHGQSSSGGLSNANISSASLIKKRSSVRPNSSNDTNNLSSLTNPNSSIVSIKEKRQLGQRIKKLPSECLQQICLILFQNLQNKEYAFDLDTLHVKKLKQLQEYVNSIGDSVLLTTASSKEHLSSNNDNQNDPNHTTTMRWGQQDDGDQSTFIIQNDDQIIEYVYPQSTQNGAGVSKVVLQPAAQPSSQSVLRKNIDQESNFQKDQQKREQKLFSSRNGLFGENQQKQKRKQCLPGQMHGQQKQYKEQKDEIMKRDSNCLHLQQLNRNNMVSLQEQEHQQGQVAGSLHPLSQVNSLDEPRSGSGIEYMKDIDKDLKDREREEEEDDFMAD